MKFCQNSIATFTAICLLLCSCTSPNQNNYGENEVGHDAIVMYGIVKSVRKVDITGNNTGKGAVIGGATGAIVGSTMGNGNGTLLLGLTGALIGAASGAVAEQKLKDRQGIEYIIKFAQTGDTRSIVQSIAKTDTPIDMGQCVMVQMSGNYQRVLPDDDKSDCHTVSHKKHIKTVLTTNHQATTAISDDPNK